MHISLRRFGKALAMAALVLGTAGQAGAQVVAWTGSGDFDDQAISFAPFLANQLVSITGPGYVHNHGSLGAVFTFDVHYQGGSWQTIFSTMIDANDHFLSEFAPPSRTFALGLIDGLRLTATPDISQAYHNMGGGNTVFTFDTGATAVPEPGTLALVAGGVVGLVGLARRRRQTA